MDMTHMKFKYAVGLTIPLLAFLLLGIFPVSAMGDTYGMGAITDLFANLWSAVWPLVALLFIIEIVLKLFGAPSFIGTIFGAVNKRR